MLVLSCVLCELQAGVTAELSGRRMAAAGITERFGDDIFEYLEKHGQMEITWPSSDPSSGGKRTWMLTNQVPLQPFGIAHTDSASLEIRQNWDILGAACAASARLLHHHGSSGTSVG